MSRSYKGLLPSGLPTIILFPFFLLPISPACLDHLILLDLINQVIECIQKPETKQKKWQNLFYQTYENTSSDKMLFGLE